MQLPGYGDLHTIEVAIEVFIIILLIVVCTICYGSYRVALRKSPTVARWRLRFGLRSRHDVPFYWENGGKDIRQGLHGGDPEYFNDLLPLGTDNCDAMQEIFHNTNTQDDKPLKILRCVRIESSVLWAQYQRKAFEIGRRRGGRCDFKGRGPPSTLEAFDTSSDTTLRQLAGDLDTGINEAFLWHGTSPQVALLIEEGGFIIGPSAAGKRFGAGGYFAEDPSKADAYANDGRGLYADCYAMLLCRVILGKQFHTQEMRKDCHAERLSCLGQRAEFESTLADSSQRSGREFIVYENAQIYPEYAFIYSRSVDKASQHPWESSESGDTTSSFPDYWENAGNVAAAQIFHDLHTDFRSAPLVQTLMNSTWIDGEGGDKPTGVRVIKVMCIEDSSMWNGFSTMQETIHKARGAKSSASHSTNISTFEKLGARHQGRLNLAVNEAYLWFGCSPDQAWKIHSTGKADYTHPVELLKGFDGRGGQFMELSSVADECSSDGEGYYSGSRAMLLCRVTLGCMQTFDDRASGSTSSGATASDNVGLGHEFDSTMAVSDAKHRIFVVPTAGGDQRQIYPEYAIVYEHVYSTSSSSDDDTDDSDTHLISP